MPDEITKTDEPILEEIPTVIGEIIEEDDEFEELLPQMTVEAPQAEQPIEKLIKDEQLLGVYDEILGLLRDQYKETTDFIDNFAEMVVNEGDATTSSKEALVNLVKIRSDIPDKMTRVADLMTRIKLKEPNTYKPYLNQTNTQTNVVITGERRQLLEAIKKAKKKGK